MGTLARVTMQTPQLGFDPRPLLILILLCGSVSLLAVLVATDENPCWQTSDDPSPPGNSSVKGLSLPLSTGEIGGKVMVIDSADQRVKLACVNWYGAHMEGFVVNGLDVRPVADIALTIASLGFNCIRLPFSLEQFYDNPIVEASRLSANPSLVGLSSLEVFDATVSALTNAGLMVILNNHNSKAGWCCSEQDGDGLWYTNQYSEQMWLDALEKMAERYSGDQLVVGIDLRNELRGAHGKYPSWGDGNEKRDWAMAAKKAGDLVLEVNPGLLVLVEGVEYAGNLEGARHHPIVLNRPRQLVYSGHEYTFWGDTNRPYQEFKQHMEERQTFVREAGHEYSAAYWMGETGTGSNDNDWGKIIRFLQVTDADWSYWAIDGYKRPGEDESFGILLSDYQTVRHPWLLQQLQSIMPSQQHLGLRE